MPDQILTERLLMRRWRASDRHPFAEMNGDGEVMEFFPGVLARTDSDALAARADAQLAERGWGLWALEVADGEDRGRFAGFTGLGVPSWDAAFTPCVEIGWRLARWAWGRGYASEAARAALEVAFSELGLDEVVSFTAVPNERSQAVMRRIGMTRDLHGDFDHPSIPLGHPLGRSVLYRLRAEDWRPGRVSPLQGIST
ncbi:GNAT family N-acetyltransferase [Microbacterium sp. NPDC055665]